MTRTADRLRGGPGSLAALLGASALLACSEDGYRARIELDGELADRVVRIELALVSQPCAAQSPPDVTGVLRVVEGGPTYGLPPLGAAPDDAVALVARGFDVACGIAAYGCTDVRLVRGGDADVVIELRAATGACEARCVDGRCVVTDGGLADPDA
ncbi:MAG: hypothetical protein IT379_26960 [Deltaproteobacteria bacterium]|nr:hypothetical protein [Deltaproteobacteria bacterium]